jgi:hypothetical protein
MKILRKNTDLNLVLNHELDFQMNLGWQENMEQFEDEVLNDIINPIDNYETVRYIHKPDGIDESDIWFYFYFSNNGNYSKGLDYSLVGIEPKENAKMLRQSTESFFRLEFYKTPNLLDVNGNVTGYTAPTRQNRKLIFTKNLTLPLGEKYFYTPLQENIHVPVFHGSNYTNKENMYLFWFQDESVLAETNLSGTTTGNTFFMTAKFFNAKDGLITDFYNDVYATSREIKENEDMYFQVDIDKRDYSYKIYKFNGTKGIQVGTTTTPIKFYESGGGTITPPLSPTPTPTTVNSVSISANSYQGTISSCDATADTPVFYSGTLGDGTSLYINNGLVNFFDGDGDWYKIGSSNVGRISGLGVISQYQACITPTPTPTPSATPYGPAPSVFYWYKLTRCDNNTIRYSRDYISGTWSSGMRVYSIDPNITYVISGSVATTESDPSPNDHLDITRSTITINGEEIGLNGCDYVVPPVIRTQKIFAYTLANGFPTFSELQQRCNQYPYQLQGGGYTQYGALYVNETSITPPTTYTLWDANTGGQTFNGNGKLYAILLPGQSKISYIATISTGGVISEWSSCS